MKKSFILLGSNSGNRIECLDSAKYLMKTNKISIKRESFVYESDSWGYASENKYLNQVLEIETILNPYELLEFNQEVEKKMGRIKSGMSTYEDRNIDIDILYFDSLIIQTQRLTIPHPKLQYRRFTLLPLCDLAADFEHPVLKVKNLELLNACKDISVVKVFEILNG